jgi:alginate O-acetyltransferase complex protein AlgI
MQFNSYIFILVCLPLTICLYYLAGKIKPIFAKIVLIAAGIAFYARCGYSMLILLGVSIVINYISALIIRKKREYRKGLLILPVIINVGLLFYFKYYGFVIQNLNALMGTNFVIRDILLPLGISFYTFQQVAYLAAVADDEITDTDPVDYLVYILYFPKFLMGPLAEPAEFISQVKDRTGKRPDAKNLAMGVKLFSAGLIKKTLFADTFATAVAWIYSNIFTSTPMDCILLMLFYTFEIYFDFSGYSDMAIGISYMLGIELPINFDSPYKALSIRDFWKRWHISLTKFLTKYIYIPLGGSKKGRIITYLNIMIVFLVSGIWHGANWTFILWGILHGILLCIDRAMEDLEKKVPKPIRWFVTFFFINILWALFSSASIGLWRIVLLKAASVRDLTISSGLIEKFAFTGTVYEMAAFLIVSFLICLVPINSYRKREKLDMPELILAVASFVCGLLCIGSESVFVYFGF